MTHRYRRPTAQAAFTLIEIAVVLLIVGFITVAGVRLLSSTNEGLRARLTRQNMDAVKAALQAYMVRAGRLPCPAVETNTPGDATYGLEAPTPGTCTGTTGLDGVAFRGVVPWKTLGMTTETAFDGWGRQLTYAVTSTATNLTTATLSGLQGSLTLHTTAPVALGLPATGNQINACSTTANDNVCNAAAAVMLVSFGPNSFGAYNVTGVRSPLPTSASEVENTDADRNFVLAEPSANFDDIVVPMSPGELLAPLYLQGMARSPQALVIERARQVISMVAAEAVGGRAGGPGTYSYALPLTFPINFYAFDATKFNATCDNNPPAVVGTFAAGTDPAQVLDPWGRVFRFARASTTINSGESCPTPMAFVSLGPDGVLGTADDVIYYSSLAEWKAIFEKAGW
ncbi:MAG TPA: type II secretion system protein [Usitatibacter sp.]|nr:type II secretion system protein [Usitatibacter sp.]